MTLDVTEDSVPEDIGGCEGALIRDRLGWRYCREQGAASGAAGGSGTKIWSVHHGIICYFSQLVSVAENGFNCDFDNIVDNETSPLFNLVLPIVQHGQYLDTFQVYDLSAPQLPGGGWPIYQELSTIWGNLRNSGGAPELDQSQNQTALFDLIVDPTPTLPSALTINGITELQAGDYIFVERAWVNVNGHGFLVVGWGPILSCPSASAIVWSFEGNNRLYLDFASANGQSIVPYVVDFPGSVDDNEPPIQTQRPRPRPFYCAIARDPDTNNFQTVNDGFAFFTFPDSITVYPRQVYTSANWYWE